MRPLHYLSALILFLIAGSIIAYKLLVLDLSFIPVKASDTWKVEITVEEKKIKQGFGDTYNMAYLPIPVNTPSQEVQSIKYSTRSPNLIDKEGRNFWEIIKYGHVKAFAKGVISSPLDTV